MTQLALLLVLGLLGSVLAFIFGRAEVRRANVSGTVQRAEGAIERASLLLLRDGAVRGAFLLSVPAVGLVTFALLASTPGNVSNLARAVFALIALSLGAVTALLQARVAVTFGARAASAASAPRAKGSASSMRPLLRASIAVAIFGEGLGSLGVATMFASLYAIRGGFAAAQPNAALAADIARLLPTFALGAAIAALALARAGSIASSAVRVGARPAERSGDDADGAHDPALLAKLVARLVGELLPTSLAGYVGGLIATVSVVLFAATAPGNLSLPVVVLVVLVKAFGSVAAVCGVLAARVTDDEAAARALWRSHLSAMPVALFGLGAALFWLLREHWLSAFVAGAAGSCSTTLVSLFAARSGTRSAARDEARSLGEAAGIVRALAGAFAGVWPSLLVPALAFVAVERGLGAQAPLGSLFVSFVAGALALAPLASSTRSFGLLAVQARDVAALARLEMEPRGRGSKLDEASALGRAAGGTQASLAIATASLLGFAALISPTSAASGFGLGALAVGIGLAVLALFGVGTVRDALSGARLVTTEVERPRPESAASYKGCVEAAQHAARAGSLLELGLLLACPFLLGAWLRFGVVPGADAALVTLAIAAVAAGLILTLGGRATRSLLTDARARSRDAGSPAATASDTFGDLVGVTLATSIEALAFVLALTVLCLAPLLR